MQSTKYPPVNRIPNKLGVLDIELVDGMGTLRVDPNRAAVMGMMRTVPLVRPNFASVLSGEPGFIYRTSEGVEAAFTQEELIRLLRRDLHPHEVLKLHSLFGVFHETHDDFYDEETGEAIQPMED